MEAKVGNPMLIYVSYASKDKKLWDALRVHMSVLESFHEAQIVDARNLTEDQSRYYLERASIILLLLSPDYIHVQGCVHEMNCALARRQAQSASVIPIRLRPLAGWSNLPFSELEVIPGDGQSIQYSRKRDKIIASIVDEISKVIELQQAVAPITLVPKALFSGTPPRIDLTSIGPRARVVEEIYTLLIRPAASGILMTGLSGIGKTKLAALVCHHVEQLWASGDCLFSEESVWLEMDATTTLVDIVDELCRYLSIPLPSAWTRSLAMLAQSFFRLVNTLEHPRLIVFDQFENVLDARTGQVRNPQDGIGALLQLLAQQPCRSRLLLVSRFPPWGIPAYPPVHLQKFEAPPLETHEAVALLRLWGVQGWKNELEEAVKYCRGHAQAIVCLHAILQNDSSVSLSSLIHEAAYRQQWIGRSARDFLEYCYVHQLSSEQRLLLRSFSIYRQPVPQNAVLEMLLLEDQALGLRVSPGRRAALDKLLSLKLIEPRWGYYYAVPPVVAESVRAYLQQEDTPAFQEAHKWAACYYKQLVEDKHHLRKGERTKIDDIRELIEAIWHLCQAQLYTQAYDLLQEEQIYPGLRRWGESVVLREIYEQFLNWQEGVTTSIYNGLGEIAAVQGQLYEARRYFTLGLSLLAGNLSTEEQVTLLSNLGAVYRKLGQLEKAQDQYQQAVQICEGGTISAEAQGVVLNNLGSLFYERGFKGQAAEQVKDAEKYAFALSYYERALSLYQQADIPDEVVRTLNNLGHVYSACQRKEEAKSTYRQALLLSQHIGAQWAQAISLANLGLLCREEAHFEEARAYYEQALRIFYRIGSNWEEATVLRNLGNLYMLNRRYDVALACFILARDIFIALQCPEQGKIPDWVEAELTLALVGAYEDWFQTIERDPIPYLEQILSAPAPAEPRLTSSIDSSSAGTAE